MSKNIKGKVVWITGGGSGIGRALAFEFVARGCVVAVSGRRTERLEQVVEEIHSQGGRAAAVECDVTSDESVMRAVKSVIEQFGQLDVAIAIGLATGLAIGLVIGQALLVPRVSHFLLAISSNRHN